MGNRDFYYKSTDEWRMNEYKNNLEHIVLAHRDIRVSRQHAIWLLTTVAGNHAWQLALSTSDRYMNRCFRPSRLNLVFFRVRYVDSKPIHINQTHLTLEQNRRVIYRLLPRINLNIVNLPKLLAENSPVSSSEARMVLDTPVSKPNVPPVLPVAQFIQLCSLQMMQQQAAKKVISHMLNAQKRIVRWQKQSKDEVQIKIMPRLTKRLKRIESAENNTVDLAGVKSQANSRPLVHPVSQVLHRWPTVPPSKMEDRADLGMANVPLRQTAAAAGDLPKVDIDHLAEEVVRTIDRRIIAHRERMGRI